jgi:predicted porin
MKKTLYLAIASATAIAATTATAATVYEDDGTTVKVSGEVDVQYRKKTTKDADAELRYDDVDLKLDYSYTDDSGITAFAYYGLDFKGGDNKVSVGDVYVGIEASNVTLTVGDQSYASDEFGIGQDIEFGYDGALGETGGDETVRVDYDMDALFLSASVDFAESDDETSFDIYASYTIADSITVAGTFQTQKDFDLNGNNQIDKEEEDSHAYFGASVSYAQDGLEAGVEFSHDVEGENSAIGASAAYDLSDKLTVGGGVGTYMAKEDEDSNTKVFGNVAYNVAGKATAYGELQYDIVDDKADDTELGYAVGMKVKF